MHVGGRVAEVVSGKSWNDLFVERIAAPLGMTQTDFFAYGPTQNPRPAGDARVRRMNTVAFYRCSCKREPSMENASCQKLQWQKCTRIKRAVRALSIRFTRNTRDLDPNLVLARYGIGMWREKFDLNSGSLQEVSSQGYFGFTPWIDVERNLAGVLSVQSRFSRIMPDYLELKKEIRRIVPADARPLSWR